MIWFVVKKVDKHGRAYFCVVSPTSIFKVWMGEGRRWLRAMQLAGNTGTLKIHWLAGCC
jgi:hypothetical protein